MHRLVVSLLVVCALCAWPRGASAQGSVRAQLDSLSVHLFLATSGTLSADVDSIKGFGARNFSVQGEGIVDNERFYAVLIKVRMTSKGEIFAQGPQAEVVVTDRRTKKVVRRERIADLYIGSQGWTFVPVFLPNAACGPFDIIATAAGRKIAKTLEVSCGE
jgi:hypothetical protein